MPKPKKRRDHKTSSGDTNDDHQTEERELPAKSTDPPLSIFSSPVQRRELPYQPPLFVADAEDDVQSPPPPPLSDADAEDDADLPDPSQPQALDGDEHCAVDMETVDNEPRNTPQESDTTDVVAEDCAEDRTICMGKPEPGGCIFLIYPTDDKNPPQLTDPTYMRYCVSQYDTFEKMRALHPNSFIYFRYFFDPENSSKRLWARRDNFHWPYIDGREDLPPESDESKWLKEPACRICLFEGLFSAPCKSSGMDNREEPTTLFFMAHPQRVPARTFLKVLFPHIKPLFIRELNWDFISDNLVPLNRSGWMEHFPMHISTAAAAEDGKSSAAGKSHDVLDSITDAEPKKRRSQQRAPASATVYGVKRKPT